MLKGTLKENMNGTLKEHLKGTLKENPTSPLGGRWYSGPLFPQSLNPCVPQPCIPQSPNPSTLKGGVYPTPSTLRGGVYPFPTPPRGPWTAQFLRGWDPFWRPRALPGAIQKSISFFIEFSTHSDTILAPKMPPKTLKNQ